MARDLKELIREAAELSASDCPTPDVQADWSKEIERRVREIDEGAVELVDWQDVRAELFAAE